MTTSEPRTTSLFRQSLAHPILIPLALLAIAVVFRIIDIFFLPLAEQTGEAFVHKALGLLLVLGYLWAAGRPVRDIGLHGRHAGEALWIGGLPPFPILAFSFGLQFLISSAAGDQPQWVITAVDSRTGVTGGLGVALFLIAGNLLNSFMEEGLFRGVMLTHFRRCLSPWRANFLQAGIFGLWHITWPIYHLVTGEAELGQAAFEALTAVFGATIAGLVYGTLYLKTDSLWASWMAHTVNNTLLNLIHIRTTGGLDANIFVAMAVMSIVYLAVVPWTLYWAKRRQLPMVRTWGESEG
jgi:membrane protease YdiL (CAAX protease family)